MKRLFFEDPFWLYVLLVMAELVLLAIWRKARTGRAARRLLIPPGIAALVFALAALVVTDRERITAATHEIIDSTSAGRVSALEKYLDPDFRAQIAGVSMDRAKVIERARGALTRFRVRKVEVKRLDIQVKGSRATMKLITAIQVGGGRRVRGFPVLFQLKWVKRGKSWRILEAAEPRLGTSF